MTKCIHCDATVLTAAPPAQAAVGGEAVAWQWRVNYDKGSPRENEWSSWHDTSEKYYNSICAEIANGRDRVQVRALHAAQPASLLRGREAIANAIREYCRSLTPAAVQDSHGIERIYYAGLSVYGLTDAILSAAPPEQPAGLREVTNRLNRECLENLNATDDGDPAGNLFNVLKRGFAALGWAQPSLAADALIDALSASPPEQPASLLRGRESVREIAHRHCTCTCRGDPEVLQNHTNLCDEISDAILEYAALFSAAPVTEGK